MVNLFVPLEMGVPGKILVAEVAFERPFTCVTQLMGLQTTWSAKCLIASDVAAGVEVDAGTAGGNPHSWVTGVLRVGDLHQITRTEDTQSCLDQAA